MFLKEINNFFSPDSDYNLSYTTLCWLKLKHSTKKEFKINQKNLFEK